MSGERKYYRVEDRRYAGGIDECGDPIPGSSTIRLSIYEYTVIRKTPKGAWIRAEGGQRFVRDVGKKRYACPTKHDAMESFRARKRRQISILSARLRDARKALALASGEELVFDG